MTCSCHEGHPRPSCSEQSQGWGAAAGGCLQPSLRHGQASCLWKDWGRSTLHLLSAALFEHAPLFCPSRSLPVTCTCLSCLLSPSPAFYKLITTTFITFSSSFPAISMNEQTAARIQFGRSPHITKNEVILLPTSTAS